MHSSLKNQCISHPEKITKNLCLFRDCKKILCSDCYKNHEHSKKEEISNHILKNYQIIKFLGSGGFGKVFAVYESGEEYALKVLFF